MQTGDSFDVYFDMLDDEESAMLAEGYNLIAAMRDYKGELILKGSTDGGRITREDDYYKLEVAHAESLKMVGKVFLELTLTANEEADIYHGDRIITVEFEPRQNNELVPGGDTPVPDPAVEIATREEIDAITEDWQ
jgi:hypothetical protein